MNDDDARMMVCCHICARYTRNIKQIRCIKWRVVIICKQHPIAVCNPCLHDPGENGWYDH